MTNTIRKSQFVSPIIILAIILISTYILLSENTIDKSINAAITNLVTPLKDMENITIQDLEYQNNLTTKILTLASTINSSGTIIIQLMQEYTVNITFTTSKIVVNYAKEYKSGTARRTINNTIIVPYPYNLFLTEEQRFDSSRFRTCIGAHGCEEPITLVECAAQAMSGTLNYTLDACMPSPLRIKLSMRDFRQPLTLTYPYMMWNNSFKTV
jgi:hypothetical protein